MNKPRKGAVQQRTEKELCGLKKTPFLIGKEEVFI
jgi:hypothetical protein